MELRIRIWDARRRNWFWDCNEVFESGLNEHELVVRLYLARCADHDGCAWPSLNTIARACGVSRPTVLKALRGLEEKGWIRRETRKTETREYDTTVYYLLDPPRTAQATRLQHSGGYGDFLDKEGCQSDCQGSKPHYQPCQSDYQPCQRDYQGLSMPLTAVGNELDSNQTHLTKPIEPNNGSSFSNEKEERASRFQCRKELAVHAGSVAGKNDSAASAKSDSGDSGSPHGNVTLGPDASLPQYPQRSSLSGSTGQGGNKALDSGASTPACNRVPDDPTGPPTNRDLIAELVERLHRIPGVEKLRGHYALVGKAYNEYGYQCVLAALDDVEAEYRGAELVGEPYPTEKELHALLFKKCRWNQKGLARSEEEKAEKPKPKNLSLKELEELGCIIERAEDGHPVSVKIPNDEVRRRVRAARGIA